MPVHDWSRIPSGLFHHFHQQWTIEIAKALNRGILPKGLSALVEQRAGAKEADVYRTTNEIYAGRANRIAVKHHLARMVAVIEILSRGNKESRGAIRDFADKTVDFLRAGVHVLVIDLFPPTRRDPLGIHKLIWDELCDEPFAFEEGKDRVLASYESAAEKAAYVDLVAVGDPLIDMPLFVAEGIHVKVPLESTYQVTWDACPVALQEAVETGVLPVPEAE